MTCSSVNPDRFILSVFRSADPTYDGRRFRGSCVDDLQDARVKRRWRSVECSHVFGLFMQLCALLALMKSADRPPRWCGQRGFPNHLLTDSRPLFAESGLGSWFNVGCGVVVLRAVRGRNRSEEGATPSGSSACAGRGVLDRPDGRRMA